MSVFLQCLKVALPATWKSASWLLKLMIPISLGVTLLQHYGILEVLASYLHPLFVHLGLPGASAIAFISGAMAGTYAGLAAMMSMPLNMKEATILGIMIALCHALPMESAVNRKTGSSFWKMSLIRIFMAFGSAFLLNLFLGESSEKYIYLGVPANSTTAEMLSGWVVSQLKMSVMVVLIIYFLMVLQRMLEAYRLLRPLSELLSPMMRFFGLPEKAAYMWLVGNVLGISYGSAVMLELKEKRVITPEDANAVNYHLIMSHSLLEDTLVLAATGIPALLLISVRVTLAFFLVWLRRACLFLFK
ncbi:MAG: nucleoside recognition domain-containing protein [Bacteroidales bacterium]|nr:nucleoside recognition domain-containing protein [Bacteroidales bacterium]